MEGLWSWQQGSCSKSLGTASSTGPPACPGGLALLLSPELAQKPCDQEDGEKIPRHPASPEGGVGWGSRCELTPRVLTRNILSLFTVFTLHEITLFMCFLILTSLTSSKLYEGRDFIHLVYCNVSGV